VLHFGRLRPSANIRLVWKGFPGTKALPYYENLSIMDAKSFIKLAPGMRKPTLSIVILDLGEELEYIVA
jgi:hypothetical protein